MGDNLAPSQCHADAWCSCSDHDFRAILLGHLTANRISFILLSFVGLGFTMLKAK